MNSLFGSAVACKTGRDFTCHWLKTLFCFCLFLQVPAIDTLYRFMKHTQKKRATPMRSTRENVENRDGKGRLVS